MSGRRASCTSGRSSSSYEFLEWDDMVVLPDRITDDADADGSLLSMDGQGRRETVPAFQPDDGTQLAAEDFAADWILGSNSYYASAPPAPPSPLPLASSPIPIVEAARTDGAPSGSSLAGISSAAAEQAYAEDAGGCSSSNMRAAAAGAEDGGRQELLAAMAALEMERDALAARLLDTDYALTASEGALRTLSAQHASTRALLDDLAAHALLTSPAAPPVLVPPAAAVPPPPPPPPAPAAPRASSPGMVPATGAAAAAAAAAAAPTRVAGEVDAHAGEAARSPGARNAAPHPAPLSPNAAMPAVDGIVVEGEAPPLTALLLLGLFGLAWLLGVLSPAPPSLPPAPAHVAAAPAAPPALLSTPDQPQPQQCSSPGCAAGSSTAGQLAGTGSKCAQPSTATAVSTMPASLSTLLQHHSTSGGGGRPAAACAPTCLASPSSPQLAGIEPDGGGSLVCMLQGGHAAEEGARMWQGGGLVQVAREARQLARRGSSGGSAVARMAGLGSSLACRQEVVEEGGSSEGPSAWRQLPGDNDDAGHGRGALLAPGWALEVAAWRQDADGKAWGQEAGHLGSTGVVRMRGSSRSRNGSGGGGGGPGAPAPRARRGIPVACRVWQQQQQQLQGRVAALGSAVLPDGLRAGAAARGGPAAASAVTLHAGAAVAVLVQGSRALAALAKGGKATAAVAAATAKCASSSALMEVDRSSRAVALAYSRTSVPAPQRLRNCSCAWKKGTPLLGTSPTASLHRRAEEKQAPAVRAASTPAASAPAAAAGNAPSPAPAAGRRARQHGAQVLHSPPTHSYKEWKPEAAGRERKGKPVKGSKGSSKKEQRPKRKAKRDAGKKGMVKEPPKQRGRAARKPRGKAVQK